MGVERYHDVAEMPRPPRPSGGQLLRQIAAVWERAHVRALPHFPRGVLRFRTLEEAQSAREVHEREQARSLRDSSIDPAER